MRRFTFHWRGEDREDLVTSFDGLTLFDVTPAYNLGLGTIGLQLAPQQGISSVTFLAGKELRFSNGTIATVDADTTINALTPTSLAITLTQGTAVATTDTAVFLEDLIVTEAYDAGFVEMKVDDPLISSITFIAGTDMNFSNGTVAKLTSETTITNTTPLSVAVTLDPSRMSAKATAHYQERLVDPNHAALQFTNLDNDSAAIIASATDAVVAATEGKANNYFSVVLTTEPTDPVTLTLTP